MLNFQSHEEIHLIGVYFIHLSVNAQLPNFCKWMKVGYMSPTLKQLQPIPLQLPAEYKLSKNVLSAYIQLPEFKRYIRFEIN